MSTRISKSERLIVYDKYNNHCGYCGVKFDSMKDMQVDHMKPKWQLGEVKSLADYNYIHSMDNLMPSCRTCNHYKRGCNLEGFRKKMKTLHERVCSHYIGKVALKYGIVTLNPFDGVFYFEKTIQNEKVNL